METLLRIILVVSLGGIAFAETYHFEPKEFYNTFSRAHKAVLTIKPGDHFHARRRRRGLCRRGARSGAPNPESGPFYIEGAEPGDTLVVHLLRLETNRGTGYSGTLLAPYAADPAFLRAEGLREPKTLIWQLDKKMGVARLESADFKPGLLELPCSVLIS
jgi:amidase